MFQTGTEAIDPTLLIFSSVALVVLVGFSAFLSSSEIAMTSMEKIRLGVLVREQPRKAKALQVLIDDPNSILSAIAIANNFSNIFASSIATVLTIHIIEVLLAGPEGAMTGSLNELSALIASVLMTIFVLIFGEITPKSLGKNNPERLTLTMIGPIVMLRGGLRPLIWAFKQATDLILKVFPKNFREEDQISVSEDQITMMLEVGEESGLIEGEEVDMIRRIFEFDDLVAKQVMVSRTEVESLEVNASLEEVRSVVKEEEHSRYPIYEEEPDNVIGILHVKDLLHCDDTFDNLRGLLRTAIFVPESKPINDLLRDFQSKKQQMAIVVDEYGGMAGIVTIEDILEEIVGEIHDEYDDPEEEIEHLGNGTYLLEGSVEIDHLNDTLELNLPTEEGTTISGLILNRLEEIPEAGKSLTVDGAHLLVEEASDKEIQKVRLKVVPHETVETES